MKARLPDPPKQLSREAKAWWKKIVAQWHLDDPALLILEGTLESFDRMRQAQALLAAEGLVVKDRFGQPKQHPASLVERDAKQAVLRGLKALGLDLEPLAEGKGGRPPAK
jgi:P27 family predicted phage terminase small subunit